MNSEGRDVSRLSAVIAISFMSCTAHAAGLMDCVVAVVKSECGRDLKGKRLWVVIPKSNPNKVTVCPTPPAHEYPAHDYSKCQEVRTGSFLVREVIPAPNYSHEFVVTLPNGKIGYIPTSDSIFLSETDPVEDSRKQAGAEKTRREECERRGQPKIGMTIEEATATCWGKPRRVVRTTTAAGVQQDFIYGSGHILRFDNERISAILETAGR